MNDRMSGWFFYYIQNVHDEFCPRLSFEWPPIGGEINPVVIGPIKITEDEVKLHLDELSRLYPPVE